MAAQDPQHDGLVSGINITPFVDVVLVLLVIFLATAKIVATHHRAIPMSLPKSSTGETVPERATVTIEKDGQLGLDGQRLDDAAFVTKVRALVQTKKNLKVIIAADGDVTHRRVLAVMDMLRKEHLTEVSFAVVPDAKGSTP